MWRALTAALLLAGGGWLAGAVGPGLQAGARQQPAPQPFRSGAQIVQVDVRVLADGRFVSDLSPADFTIKEDGVPQTIESVVLVGGASAAGAPGMPPAPRAVWVFVFDTDHLSPGGLTRTRDAIVAFVGERFRQGDVGGVISGGRMANNRLTSVREELRAAAAAVKMPGDMRSRQLELREWPRLQDDREAWLVASGDRQAMSAAVTRACNEEPDGCRKGDPDLQILEKARRVSALAQLASRRTLAAVEALSGGLARIPGAKTVVFLSEGFFLQGQEADLRHAVGLAARAGARFYAIDARGLNKGSGGGDVIDQPLAGGGYGAQQTFDAQADGPNSLAIDTGGFAIRNENDVGRALERIRQDSGTYYVVSYTPSNAAFDGKYRSIDVSVGRAGVKVRARRGYLALEPAVLLRPAAGSGSTEPGRSTPDLPVSPGAIAPGASVPGESIAVTPSDPAASAAVRTRIAGNGMIAALGGTDAPAGSAAALGWSAYQMGDVATAAARLAEAAGESGARPWVRYALGLAEFAQRRYKKAAAAWERVVRDVPEFEPVYFGLADAYGLQGEDTAALRMLREAARRWPSDPEVQDAIGVIHVKRGALDAAIDAFDTATKISPRDAIGWFNLGRALQMRWVKSQRYDRQREQWIGPDEDRRRATAAFQAYLDLGGPYDAQARQAMSALAWK